MLQRPDQNIKRTSEEQAEGSHHLHHQSEIADSHPWAVTRTIHRPTPSYAALPLRDTGYARRRHRPAQGPSDLRPVYGVAWPRPGGRWGRRGQGQNY